jgi:hypothetical protein
MQALLSATRQQFKRGMETGGGEDADYVSALFFSYVIFLSSFFFLDELTLNGFFLFFLAPITLAPIEWRAIQLKNINIPIPNKISLYNQTRNLSLCRTPLCAAIIIYMFQKATISYLFPVAENDFYSQIYFFEFFELFLPSLLIFLMATIRVCVDYPRFYSKFFFVMGPVVATNALINIYLYFKSIPNLEEFQSHRLIAQFGSGIEINSTTPVCFTYALYLFGLTCGLLKVKSKPYLFVAIFSILPLISGIILSQTRGGLIGLLVTLAVVAIFSSSYMRKHLLIKGALIIGAFMSVPQIRDFAFIRQDTHRFEVWQKFWELSKERIIFGYGDRYIFSVSISDGEFIHHGHNILFNALLRGGVIGFATLAYSLFMGIYRALVYFRKYSDPTPFGGLVMLLISGMVDFELHIGPSAWLWSSLWLPIFFALGADAALRQDQHKNT